MRAVGLKVAAARLRKASLEPGGEVYTSLVVRGRLMPSKNELPKTGGTSDLGNPNDESSTSDLKSSSSGHTQMTSLCRCRDQFGRRSMMWLNSSTNKISWQKKLVAKTLEFSRRLAMLRGVVGSLILLTTPVSVM